MFVEANPMSFIKIREIIVGVCAIAVLAGYVTEASKT